MALSNAIIKNRLSAVPSNQIDNEAQNIINGATPSELKNLDVEGVLRLYEALAMLPPRVFSDKDAAALKKLKRNTQFQPISNELDFAVKLVKQATRNSVAKSQLTPNLVKRIYAAESKRLSLLEKIGIDGKTIGRGQLGQQAYQDVKNTLLLKKALKDCLAHAVIPKLLDSPRFNSSMPLDFNRYEVLIPTRYANVIAYTMAESFVVAAYLAIRIKVAIRASRTPKDTARFAVAMYHGMYRMVSDVQAAINESTLWKPVEAELLKQGKKDQIAYVNEVVL